MIAKGDLDAQRQIRRVLASGKNMRSCFGEVNEKQGLNVSTDVFRSFIPTGHIPKDSKSGKYNTHYSKGAKHTTSNYSLTPVVGKQTAFYGILGSKQLEKYNWIRDRQPRISSPPLSKTDF